MKYILMLCILSTVSGCVAEFPDDRRYGGNDHYDRDHDRNGENNRRDDDNSDRRHDDDRRDHDNH